MPLRITYIPDENKLCHRLSLPMLEHLFPRELVCDLLSQHQRWFSRERKLNAVVMVYLLIVWHLFLQQSLLTVFGHLFASFRLFTDEALVQLPTRAALTYRRKQLGFTVLRDLFERVCVPLATPQTPGAFAFGYRLMAIDGTLEDVADTPKNVRYFGRRHEGDSQSPYPQARCAYLCEIGTHAIVGAVIAPCRVSEVRLAHALLSKITAGMLIFMDRGFPAAAFLEAIRERGAHACARLSKHYYQRPEKIFEDGSYLTTLTPRNCEGLREPLQVRIVEYRIKEELAEPLSQQPCSRSQSNNNGTNPEIKKVHRIMTTILDPAEISAMELILLYHERWEIELVIDEQKDHLRISQHPLRSHLPGLVLQELYGLLLAHYAVRHSLFESSCTYDLDPDCISFTRGIEVLAETIPWGPVMDEQQGREVVARMQRELVQTEALVEPRRPRFNCRVIKHTCIRFYRKKPQHQNITLKNTAFADFLELIPRPSPPLLHI